MEEIAEEDLEVQFSFDARDGSQKYVVILYGSRFEMQVWSKFRTGRSLISIQLDIGTTITWAYEQSEEIAFGIFLNGTVQYFYADSASLVIFRKMLCCRVSFGSLRQDYLIQEKIGYGSFSEAIIFYIYQVYQCFNLRSCISYALKCIKIRNESHVSQIRQEIALLQRIKHSGVIKIIDVYRMDFQTYALVTELVNGQSLDCIIHKQKQKKSKLQERDIQMIIQQTLEVLHFLHSHNVIHRDIKPNHIFLTVNRDIKIIDLGLGQELNTQNIRSCGTPGYLSPELFKHEGWSDKCDIFSLGVVFYKLLNRGVSCFDGQSSEQVIEKNRHCRIQFNNLNGYSEQAIDLVQQMLKRESKERITSLQALKHKFFKEDNISDEWKSDINVYKTNLRPSHLSRVNSHHISNNKVLYQVQVKGSLNEKTISKRYSDLKNMHEKLLAKVNDFKLSVQLPLFPGRKFFGRTNDSQDSIRTRGKELQDYLQIVLNLDKLWVFQTVKEFLPPGEDDSIMIMPSKSEYSKDRCWTQMDELKRSFLERQEKIFEARNVKKGYKSSPMVIHGYSQRYYFSFEDYTELNETIVYTICLTDAKHNKSYRFTARYSDIRGYHVLLKKNSFKQILPKFPKRKIIGQTNDNPLEINERMEQLQSYLNSIFGQPEFERCDIMQYFISKIKIEEQSHSEKRMSNPPLGSPINMSSDRIIEQKSI